MTFCSNITPKNRNKSQNYWNKFKKKNKDKLIRYCENKVMFTSYKI